MWVDRSPHRSGRVVLDGVGLHYLDWGGTGDALLCMAGAGDSAHIFDDLAPRFTDRFRVLALTRRGHGESDRPDAGYDLPTLVEDVRGFLDALGIERAHLAGHSMAGDELTLFAQRYPERVGRLVYLDSSLRHLWLDDHAADPLAPPPPAAADFASPASLRDWLRGQFGFWSEAQEANLGATMAHLPDGSVRAGLPRRVSEALLGGLAGVEHTRGAVRVPALGLFALTYEHPRLDEAADEAVIEAAEAYTDRMRAQQAAEIAFWQEVVPHGRVVVMTDADHYLFIERAERVVARMRAFLTGEGDEVPVA